MFVEWHEFGDRRGLMKTAGSVEENASNIVGVVPINALLKAEVSKAEVCCGRPPPEKEGHPAQGDHHEDDSHVRRSNVSKCYHCKFPYNPPCTPVDCEAR